MDDRILSGHYAKKQLLSASALIRFSHRRRFETARRLVAPHAGPRLLDYGSGDGTFAATVTDLFTEIVGADVDPDAVQRARERLSDQKALTFCSIEDLRDPKYLKAFPVVTCMETLEHCLPDEVERIVQLFSDVLSPHGTLIISVPIEIGPTLLAKQMIRVAAGWRRIGDYQYTERYTLDELRTMFFANERSSIERPVYFEKGMRFHGHKGFNWKSLRHRLAEDFVVTQTGFSPFSITRGLASSQAWLTCRAKR